MIAQNQQGSPARTQVAAGILSTVLAVSLVIATLCASLIFLAYYYRLSTVQHTVERRLSNNAQSGIHLLLAATDQQSFPTAHPVDLFGKGQDSVWLQQKPWGLYQVAMAKARVGERSKEMIALTGHYPSELGKAALYLSDEQRPLSIAGNTYLNGTCYLPRAGIKSAYVNRVGYQGKQLINGSTLESKSTLPPLSAEALTHFRMLLAAEPQDYQWLASLPDSLIHSFADASLYHHRPSSIILKGTLQGNIIVASDQQITLTAQSHLDGIIVTAPRIVMEPGFTGRVQALATDTLLVSPNCHLRYPSTLLLLSARGAVHLEEDSRVEGTVVITGEEADYHWRLLQIEEGATVAGMVYTDGLVALKGSIHGHLSCRKFLLRTPSTLYENHILDGTIDPSRRSPYFLASSLWAVSNQKGIVQWLY